MEKAARGDRSRAGRNTAAQLHPARRDALPDRGGRGLRLGRIRADPGPAAPTRGLGRLPCSQNGLGATRQAAWPRPLELPRMDRGAPHRDRRCADRRRRHGHGFLGYAGDGAGRWRPPTFSSSPRCSARWRRSIRIVQGDTDQANGVGSVGSRSAFVGGSAVVVAGRKALDEGKSSPPKRSKPRRPTSSTATGASHCRHRSRDRSVRAGGAAAAEARSASPRPQTPSGPSWPNGAQVCEVEIDPDTGEVEVRALRQRRRHRPHHQSHDRGGQIHGGIAQGVGQALYEQVVYDPASGQLLTGSLMDYGVPRADQLPAPRLRVRREHSLQDQPARGEGLRRDSAPSARCRQPCTQYSTRCRTTASRTSICRSRRRRSGACCAASAMSKGHAPFRLPKPEAVTLSAAQQKRGLPRHALHRYRFFQSGDRLARKASIPSAASSSIMLQAIPSVAVTYASASPCSACR